MIRELQKGDRLTADFIRDLVREVRRNRVAAGPGLRLTGTPEGSVISLAPHCSSPRSASGMMPPQWRINLTVDSGGAPLLRVHRGIAHWGGQHWVVWPVGGHDTADTWQDLPLALADGAAALVLWHTNSAPCPLYHCPLQPAGPKIDFRLSGDDCACTLHGYPRPGHPENFIPTKGAVSLHDPDTFDNPEWTDCVPLGLVTRAGDSYTVLQLHDSTIFVRAIIRYDTLPPDDGSGEGEDGVPEDPPPPCGHPGNEPGAGGDSTDGDDTNHHGDGHIGSRPGDYPSPPSSGECE